MKLDPRILREFSGLNQTDFWEAIGITQSGGSRYENKDRKLPKPVEHLLRLIYIEKIDPARIRRGDIELIEFLKKHRWPTYRKLRREAAEHRRKA